MRTFESLAYPREVSCFFIGESLNSYKLLEQLFRVQYAVDSLSEVVVVHVYILERADSVFDPRIYCVSVVGGATPVHVDKKVVVWRTITPLLVGDQWSLS